MNEEISPSQHKLSSEYSIPKSSVCDEEEGDDGDIITVNEYTITGILGEGAYSTVYISHDANNEQYAIKAIDKSKLKRARQFKKVNGKMVMETAMNKIQEEIAIMKRLSHPHIARLIKIIDSDDSSHLYMVIQYIEKGAIMTWNGNILKYEAHDPILLSDQSGLTDTAIYRIVKDITSALEYLHKNRIVHRDIKPENILQSQSNQFLLADYGVAHLFKSNEDSHNSLTDSEGTLYFYAPEMLSGNGYTGYYTDLWAFGVTIYILHYSVLPFFSLNVTTLFNSIMNDEVQFPEPIDNNLKELIKGLLEKDPNKRWKIDDLKKCEFLNPPLNCSPFVEHRAPVICLSSREIDEAITPLKHNISYAQLKRFDTMYKMSESHFSSSIGPNYDDYPTSSKLTLNSNLPYNNNNNNNNNKITIKSPHKKQTLLSPLVYSNNKFIYPPAPPLSATSTTTDISDIRTKHQSLQTTIIKPNPMQNNNAQDSLSVGTVASYKYSSASSTPKSKSNNNNNNNKNKVNNKKPTPTTPMFLETFDKDLFDENEKGNVEVKKSGCGCVIF